MSIKVISPEHRKVDVVSLKYVMPSVKQEDFHEVDEFVLAENTWAWHILHELLMQSNLQDGMAESF
jgi:hypothetical protein